MASYYCQAETRSKMLYLTATSQSAPLPVESVNDICSLRCAQAELGKPEIFCKCKTGLILVCEAPRISLETDPNRRSQLDIAT